MRETIQKYLILFMSLLCVIFAMMLIWGGLSLFALPFIGIAIMGACIEIGGLE